MQHSGLGWFSIVRLGLVQASMGGIVAMTTSTLNRVMVIEVGLAAIIPGILVGLHYAVQLMRPVIGVGVDRGRRFTPWILAGMAALAGGGILSAAAVPLFDASYAAAMALSIFAFLLIGLGVGMAGTTLLTFIACKSREQRRPAAATIAWVLMIAGIIASTLTAGQMLDPFTYSRLLMVFVVICGGALVLAGLAVWGVEKSVSGFERKPQATPEAADKDSGIVSVMLAVWREPRARAFTVFVFLSMLAYSAQDLILEPYAGRVFGLSVGDSTSLAGFQHQGVLLGMIAFGVLGSIGFVRRRVPLVAWTLLGCLLSAAGLGLLAVGGMVGESWPLYPNVFLLGFGNGIFAVGAIGTMFNMAGEGKDRREGTRVGFWGAAQAMAFAIGGLVGTGSVDIMQLLGLSPVNAYVAVFSVEAVLFIISAQLAIGLVRLGGQTTTESLGRGLLELEGQHHAG